jgi:hypothetical protein
MPEFFDGEELTCAIVIAGASKTNGRSKKFASRIERLRATLVFIVSCSFSLSYSIVAIKQRIGRAQRLIEVD